VICECDCCIAEDEVGRSRSSLIFQTVMRHDTHVVMMVLTRLLATLVHLYNLVGWLKLQMLLLLLILRHAIELLAVHYTSMFASVLTFVACVLRCEASLQTVWCGTESRVCSQDAPSGKVLADELAPFVKGFCSAWACANNF